MKRNCDRCQAPLVGSMSLSAKLEKRAPLKCDWCGKFYCNTCARKDADCLASGCTGVLTDYTGNRQRTIYEDGPRYRAKVERSKRDREGVEKKARRTRERVDESFSKAKLLERQKKKLAAKRQIQKTEQLISDMRQLIDTHRLRLFTHKSLDAVERKLGELKETLA